MRNIRFTPSKGTLMKYRSAETKLCFVTVKILHQIYHSTSKERLRSSAVYSKNIRRSVG